MTTTHSSAQTVSPVARLIALLRLERNDLWVAIVFSVAIGVLSLAAPIATQALVNTVAFGSLIQPLVFLTLLVLGLLAVSAVLQALRFHVVEMLQRRLFVRMASESVHRLLHARVDVLRENNGPELVNRFLDVVTVQKAGATLLIDGLSIFTQTFAGMALLAVYHPWLLAFDAGLLVAVLVVLIPAGHGAIETAVKESKSKYALVAWLEETARNERTFRATAPARFAAERTDSLVQNYLGYRTKHFRIVMRQLTGSLVLQAIASATLLGVGGMLVIERQLTLGQLVAAELVVAAVLASITKLAKHLEIFYDLLASLDKLGSLTDLPGEMSGSGSVESTGPAAISMRGPSFHVDVHPGEKVALCGLSGSGKSSLIDTICGYRDAHGTSVTFDGVDIRSLKLGEYRSQTGLVRGVEIFHGSILDNIRVGRDLSVASMQRTLEQVGLWSTIQDLPRGLETILSTGGHPLSEGQKQALMIVRAIAGNPRLLIIDETLDAVQDSAERELLTSILFAPDAPWTLLLVTARVDLERRCSRIVEVTRHGLKEVA
ncbi:MAG: ABC transporter ATP-binding protein [Bryobacteraceae bacterium]